MKTANLSNKTSINKRSKLENVWGVYNNQTGNVEFIGMSRSAARDYRATFDENNHLTGPRKINVTAYIA